MTLAHANRMIHCRIVALAAIMTIVMISAFARIAATDVATASTPLVALEIGKLGMVAALDATVTR
jgi:hypothetical protein